MTKLFVTLSLALVAASFAGAADIALKDGRVLREAVVVKHDAATVTFRHAAGFAQIEKSKLPEALAAEYPLDAAEARLEAGRQQQEVLARRAEAERLYALRVQLAAAAPKPEEVPAYEEPKQDTTSTTSWADTYNAESWRLMRIRARNHDHNRDRDRDHAYNRRSNFDNRRDCDRTAPGPRSAQTARMTPDVHMTPDVKMVGFDTPPSSTVPPTTVTDHRVQRPRRF